MSAKANTKMTIAKSMEISDLNGAETGASLQIKGKGRVSQQALEVLSNTPEMRDAVETEVLYQRLGNTWYAFTQVNDEVYYSKVSAAQVAEARAAGQDRVATLLRDEQARAARSASDEAADIEAMFHRPATATGHKTRNGGGNA